MNDLPKVTQSVSNRTSYQVLFCLMRGLKFLTLSVTPSLSQLPLTPLWGFKFTSKLVRGWVRVESRANTPYAHSLQQHFPELWGSR